MISDGNLCASAIETSQTGLIQKKLNWGSFRLIQELMKSGRNVIHLDLDPGEIGGNFETRVAWSEMLKQR